MPISVQCDACGKRYKVADKLAGKKVRCKSCNAVMSVSTEIEADDLAPEPDLSVVPSEPFSLDKAIADAHRKASQGQPGASGAPGRTGDDVFDQGSDDDGRAVASPTYSANPAFRFGGAAELDAVLPWLLAVVSVGWLVVDTFHTGDAKHAWVAQARWALYLLLYVAIVFPLVNAGVKRAAARSRFGLPTNAGLKTFGSFAFPYTLGMVLALHGGGIVHFVIGALVGLILGLSAFWFFFRLRPWQTANALLTAAGFFAIGATVALGLLLAANAAMLPILNGYKTAHTFAQSPVGPFLNWNPPPAPVEEKKTEGSGVELTSTSGQPGGEVPTSQPVATTEPTTNPSTVATTQPEPDKTAIAANTSPNPTPNGTEGAPAESPKAEDGGNGKPAMVVKANTTPDGASPSTDTPTTSVPPPTPEVKEPKPLAESAPAALIAPPQELAAGEFDDITFAPPTAPNTTNALAAIVKARGDVSDEVELWSLLPGEKKAAATPQHPAGSSSKYFAGPRGAVVAWMVDFPRKQVEVRGLANDKFFKEVMLDTERLGDPKLLGFGINEQIVVFWDRGGDCAIQGLSYINGQHMRGIEVHGWAKAGAASVALSPDGKLVAIASDGDTPSVQIVEMYGSRSEARRILLPDLQHKQPNFAGMAFNADGSKLAILYEEGKNTLLLGCRVANGQVLTRQVFFDTLMADHPAQDEYKGPTIDWVHGDTQWMLYGRVIVDTEKPVVIGKIGIPGVKTHAVLDKETIAFVAPGATAGKQKLLIGKLPPMPGKTPGRPAAAASSEPGK